jgi:hypothetical protein
MVMQEPSVGKMGQSCAAPFKLVMMGMALAFFSLFFRWESPRLVQTYRHIPQGTAETHYPDGHVERHILSMGQTIPGELKSVGGGNGFDIVGPGPIVIALLVTYLLAGFVAWRRRLKSGAEPQKPTRRWPAFLALAGLALMTWNAVIYLSFITGKVMYLGGVALAGVGGLRGWGPELRRRGSAAQPAA